MGKKERQERGGRKNIENRKREKEETAIGMEIAGEAGRNRGFQMLTLPVWRLVDHGTSIAAGNGHNVSGITFGDALRTKLN